MKINFLEKIHNFYSFEKIFKPWHTVYLIEGDIKMFYILYYLRFKKRKKKEIHLLRYRAYIILFNFLIILVE